MDIRIIKPAADMLAKLDELGPGVGSLRDHLGPQAEGIIWTGKDGTKLLDYMDVVEGKTDTKDAAVMDKAGRDAICVIAFDAAKGKPVYAKEPPQGFEFYHHFACVVVEDEAVGEIAEPVKG